MSKFKCNHCGKESDLVAGASACPFCQADFSQDDLTTMVESADMAATLETSIPKATLQPTPKQGAQTDKDHEASAAVDATAKVQISIGNSSKTAMAGDLGYSNSPVFMRTLDKSPTTPDRRMGSAARNSAGRSSAIPARTVGDEKSGDELRDYRLEQTIGQGSFGTVYRALQVPLDRHVALKLLKPLPLPANTEGDQSKVAREAAETKVRDEFLREAQFTGKLEHPNIVPIHDIGIVSGGEQSDRPFYVMKEIKGISWQDVLAEKSRDENVDIFESVVDAIGFSHSRNILHCDLKPENVMLGEFGEVLVVDWGQAIDMTQPETFRPGGTPSYCSPEMAQYWCDFGIGPDKAEISKTKIGPASDVYLLGAILFHIVTGRPPHYGLKGENAAQVMARAARNEIRQYDQFEKDELLQIALRAMRLTDQPSITNVAELKTELKSYEDRKQSIDIRDRAFALLESAKLTNDYDSYQKAKFGFEESLELWPENPTARDGLQQTRLDCAALALVDQNFDLGLGMLDRTDTEAESTLKDELQRGKRSRDRRKRLVAVLGVGFAAAVLIGLAVTAFLGNKALEQTQIAQTKTIEAKQAEAKAVDEQEKASVAVAKSEQAEQKAAEAEQLAEAAEAKKKAADALAAKAQALAIQQERLAKEQEKIAAEKSAEAKLVQKQIQELEPKIEAAEQAMVVAKAAETEARQAADAAREASRLLLYKTEITSVTQRANAKDFGGTRERLDALAKSSPTATGTYEWRRLNLLAHPEVTAVSHFPEDPLIVAQLSGDRQILALCFRDRIEIRKATEPHETPIKVIPTTWMQKISLSYDGRKLAIAKPEGVIQILDVSTGQELLKNPLQAQTIQVTDMEFSNDGQRLLTVGIPDRIKSSVGAEHQLMLWLADGDEWTPMPNPKFRGARPYLSDATFSTDGNRIVTSNPNGTPNHRPAFVLELVDDTYEWIGPADIGSPQRRPIRSGFLASTFADDAGQTVISSFQAAGIDSASSNQIVVWDVMEERISDSEDDEQLVSISFEPSSLAVSNELYPQFRPGQTVVLDAPVNDLDFNGNILLATQEKEMIYWELPTGDRSGLQLKPKKYGGHGSPIGFTKILNSGSKFITIAVGADPEVLVTDTSLFRKDDPTIRLTDELATAVGSPMVLFNDTTAKRAIVANDQGLVSIHAAPNGIVSESPLMKWQTSAWEKHLTTNQHLFALSKRDDLFRYNLDSGELETILTGLSKIGPEDKLDSDAKSRIVTLAISANSQFAVLQRQNDRPEFEIWNLESQQQTIVPFADLQGFENSMLLPQLTISDDGQWIAGGRVRFYVWRNDGTVVGNAGTENSEKQPLNCLKFFADSSELVAGRKGLLRTYQVQPQLVLREAYPISELSDNLGQPNIIDARIINEKEYVVIESIADAKQGRKESGLSLIELNENKAFKTVAHFPAAGHATWSSTGKLFAVTLNPSEPLIEFDLATNQQRASLLTVPARDAAGKFTEERSIFSRIFAAPGGDLVIGWSVNGQQNTVSVSPAAGLELSKLSVIATPTIRSVGLAGNRAATFENGRIRFWNLDFEKRNVTAAGSLTDTVRLFQLSPPGTQALVDLGDNQKSQLALLDLSSQTVQKLDMVALPQSVTATAWSDDASRIALGMADGSIGIVSIEDRRVTPLGVAPFSKAIQELHFSGDGKSLVVLPQAIKDAANANEEPVIVMHQKTAADENGNNQVGVVAGDPRWITVRLSHSDNDAIQSVDISADGTRVVTGSAKGRVTLWNTESQVGSASDRDSSERELLSLDRLGSTVRMVRFSENETSVVAFETNSPTREGRVYPTAPAGR